MKKMITKKIYVHECMNCNRTLFCILVCSYAAVEYRKVKKHRHRRNVTSHHFTSLLFTSFHFYVYSNFFGSYQLKGKYNTHTHIEKLNIFHHFSSLPLLLSIERQKQYKYIYKAIQKVQSSSYIFVIDPDKFEIL